MSTTIIVTGNATAVPSHRQTGTGKSVSNFSVADNRRVQVNGEWTDAEPTFYEVTCWGDLADQAHAVIVKGQRVTVVGRLETQQYDAEDGPRKTLVLVADEAALNIRFGLK
jgi:single-strand DNA-binding protein